MPATSVTDREPRGAGVVPRSELAPACQWRLTVTAAPRIVLYHWRKIAPKRMAPTLGQLVEAPMARQASATPAQVGDDLTLAPPKLACRVEGRPPTRMGSLP